MRILIPNRFSLQGSDGGIYIVKSAEELVRLGHGVLDIVPEQQAILEDQYCFATKGTHAARYAREGFSWSRQAAKMATLHDGAVGGTPGS